MASEFDGDLAEPQRLALAYATPPTRALTAALLALDGRLAAIVRRRGEPMLAQMRLAWWRETLEAPCEGWPVGEPILAALTRWKTPGALAALAEGWEHLLADNLDAPAITGFATGREIAMAALAAETEVEPGSAARAARSWALGDLAANLTDPAEKSLVVALADTSTPPLLPRPMRPLAVLAALGRRSLLRGGRPLLEGRGAAATALRVGLLGR